MPERDAFARTWADFRAQISLVTASAVHDLLDAQASGSEEREAFLQARVRAFTIAAHAWQHFDRKLQQGNTQGSAAWWEFAEQMLTNHFMERQHVGFHDGLEIVLRIQRGFSQGVGMYLPSMSQVPSRGPETAVAVSDGGVGECEIGREAGSVECSGRGRLSLVG